MKTKMTVLRGLKLREYRKNKKLSLRQMADLVSKKLGRDVSYASINRYENGSACDMDVLIAICSILDVDALKLLEECMNEAA